MGASAWTYVVPYVDDVNEALQALRWEVFRAGDYAAPPAAEVPTLEAFVPPDPQIWGDPDELAEWKEMHAELVERLTKKPPKSPNGLLKRCGEDGTHSIIDIRRISATDKKSESGGMKRKDRMALFGTDKPSRQQVEAVASRVTRYRKRGLCTYVVVFDGAEPSALFFAGTSGD